MFLGWALETKPKQDKVFAQVGRGERVINMQSVTRDRQASGGLHGSWDTRKIQLETGRVGVAVPSRENSLSKDGDSDRVALASQVHWPSLGSLA